MPLQTLFTKNKGAAAEINCQEAYSLWDLTAAKYFALTKFRIWLSYVKDQDLKYLMSKKIEHIEGRLKKLEDELRNYDITGPDSGLAGVNNMVNTEAVRDEFIVQDAFIWLQENVELHLKVLRTSTTNDRLRQNLLKMAKEVIDDMDDIVRYMRMKGWINIAPLYPNIPSSVTEKLDAGEAFHLWDHLTFRYDNIHQTTIYYGYAVDTDFKAFLYTGIRELLVSQAEVLERECLHFGIPLPKRPPKVVATQAPNEAVPDDYMYRQISMGITGAALMHATALKQCLTNDRVRGLFKELLLSEIDLQDMLIKYGKMKGWLNHPPNYKLGIS